MSDFDLRLIDYAETGMQREKLEAWRDEGSQKLAAKKLGCSDRAIRLAYQRVKKSAAKQGYAPGHFQDGVAPGFRMGKVTVQRGPSGVERVWERQHPANDAFETFKDVIEEYCESLSGLAPPIAPPEYPDEDLMTVYPMGDPHGGLLAWEAETGENFDLKEFDRRLRGAIDRLVQSAPESTHGLFINQGDMLHADDGTNRTPSGNNALDVDGRHAKVALVIFDAMIYAVNRLREKHAKVTVWNKMGNHDPHAWLMLALALASYFKDDPRVDVPIDPCMFTYLRFGKNLFGATHGHGPKMEELPMIMAHDRKEDWGKTDHRVWFIGHWHHRKVIQDLTGCTVEIARTLASSDAWHHGKGYRSKKDMQAIVYHRDHGEIERHTCSLSMIV